MENSESKKMDFKFAKQAIIFTSLITLVVTLYELAQACSQYTYGMNIFDFAALASRDDLPFSIIFVFVTLIFLPFALVLYKEKGISLKNEIYEKKTLLRDIGLGFLALIVKYILGGLFLLIKPDSSVEVLEPSNSTLVLATISLVFLSGILKEIYFRGLAKTFAAPVLGETAAFLLFNMLFGILDWPNLGLSFVSGLVWAFFYKKSGHLITPMIGHAGANLIYLLGFIIK